MQDIDLRSVTFTCKTMDGTFFETTDINLIGEPTGEVHFWVDDKECESVTVNGVDLKTLTFVGDTYKGAYEPWAGFNSISFNDNEGIYYIDNIPCKKVTLFPK